MKNLCVSSKGQALVLIAVTMVVLLVLAGLAVDIGMAYGVKAKLNAAVDAAAIAAGKVISQGKDAASTRAADFFNANYPSGSLGSTLTATPVTNAEHNPDGSWTITVTVTASVPTNFARLAGWNDFSVNASATTTVRTLDLVLVLDSSGSLLIPAGTPDTLRREAKKFVENFDTSSDRVGLIHFASGAVADVTITDAKGFKLEDNVNKDGIKDFISRINVAGATTSEEAMRMARAQLDAIPVEKQNSLRAIVFFSDGAPNGIAGNFVDGVTPVLGDLYSDPDRDPCGNGRAGEMYSINRQNNSLPDKCNITTLPNTDYTGSVNLQSDLTPPTRTLNIPIANTMCNVNMAARNMLENVANAARSEAPNPIHIFTIGLGRSLTIPETTACGYGTRSAESGENILKRLANVPDVDTYNKNQPTGLYAHAADASELDRAFKQIANAILRLSK